MGRGPTEDYHRVMNENYVEGTLTCLRKEVIRDRITPEFPLVLNIEPTNNCNSRCYYCPRERMIGAQGTHYLPLERFQRIIDQIGERRLIMLNLHKDGEPLLHRDLPAMVDYARQKKAAQVIHLNTNGTLLTTSIGRGIIEQGIDDITVSVDAAREETYRKCKGLTGLARLEDGIRKTIEYRDAIDSPTRIRVKIMEFGEVSADEIALFYEKWQGVADEVQVTGVHSWSGAIENLAVTDEQSEKRYPCGLLWYMLAVNSNGKVSVCNVDWDYSGVVGDLATSDIAGIWNGPAMKAVRRAHLAGIWNCPSVCQDCVVWVSVGDMGAEFRRRPEFL